MTAQEIVEELMGELTLLHFSSKAYLTSVSPKFQGTAQAGEERSSPDYRKPAFSNWYVKSDNSFIEPIFWNAYVYTALIDSSKLNDQSVDYLSNKDAKRAGFSGVYYNLSRGDEQVRLFVPVRVSLAGKVEGVVNKRYGQITGRNIFRYLV